MKNKFYFILLAVFCSSACGYSPLTRKDTGSLIPYVASSTVDSESVSLSFSEPIEAATVTNATAFIATQTAYADALSGDWQDLYDAVVNGDLAIEPSTLILSDDHLLLTLLPDQALLPNETYVVVALPKILSMAEHLPINQEIAGGADQSFATEFTVVDDVITASNSSVSESDSASSAATTMNDSDSSSTTTAADTTSDTSTNVAAEEAPSTTLNTDRVFLTEIVTDPQQDHGDSSGGNGIAFDPVPGAGTIGTTDEYVEIFNGSDVNVDVSNWTVKMVDGTDTSVKIKDLSTSSFFSLGGTAEALASGEVLVLGNPPGDMKNAVTVSLLDDSGATVDEVVIADGYATNLADEAMAIDVTDTWTHDAASPGWVEF